ncbi:MAG TPA: ELM1/GtrOC1 family putative glycosyltransferase [Spongiibacteraceae bacterium]|nr:ELM1/GtrOC1 family putative glycosyltransferase [Spongiibacteraceae bacterium]
MPTIHAYTDNKPGHRSQLQGLLQALATRCELDVQWVSTPGGLRGIGAALRTASTPAPALILACGTATHLPALIAGWRSGAPVVVLMKPACPALFDLCVIPEHDGPVRGGRLLRTRGMLNAQRYRPRPGGGSNGLILLGGPSRHYQWDTANLVRQLDQILQQLPQVRWTLTTSRRTPPDTVAALAPLGARGLVITPWEDTPAGWLTEALDAADYVWVSEDSASMVYESLSSGATVGVLQVPATHDNKLRRGVAALLEEGQLTSVPRLAATGAMQTRAEPLAEAQRVADHILEHLLK